MGGKGSGGARPNSGPRRKSAAERALDGNAGHRGRVLPHPSVPAAALAAPVLPAVEIDEADAPNDLTMEERHVWLEHAPEVKKNGMLTSTYAYAFKLLCRNILLERRYALSVTDAGGPGHRGMIAIVDREMLRFGLAPIGKPADADGDREPAVDPMQAKYFG